VNTPRGRAPGPTGLPIEDAVPAIREALRAHSCLVLTAEPGAGKTTVVPLRLLGEEWLDGAVLVLEPRRVAARAAASRMAGLLGEQVGETVGVTTRDGRRVGRETRIEVVTEGVLTRRLQHDPELSGVGAVVFDEFHERSLQADLGLALTLDVQRSLRPDLRVVVMSATIDADRLQRHLGGCPVVSSPGRLHPVRVEWAPLGPRDRIEAAMVAHCTKAVADGESVLAFLPGAGEIGRVVESLGERGVRALPLHGGLPPAEQDAALEPAEEPTVVVSTDVAETSLTVPGVTVVVDSGLRRSPRFHPGAGMSRLETIVASRASADQRAGRAGRVRAGTAVRLWSEAENLTRPRFDRPEILEADLTDLVLQLAAWGVGPGEAALIDPAPNAAVDAGRELLTALGLLDDGGRITAAGRAAAELGVHPRLAAMLAAAGSHPWTAAVLAAVLEERDLLGGRVSERSADIEDRLVLVERRRGRGAAVHRRARALARRVGGDVADLERDRVGFLLASGFPDRIGRRQTGTTRFLLTGGPRVEVARTDPLAAEEWVVAADIDGERADGRLLRGAGLDPVFATEFLASLAETSAELRYDGARDAVLSVEREMVGPVVLAERSERRSGGPEVAGVLCRHLRRVGVDQLPWTAAGRALRQRSEFVRARAGIDDWPDLSDEALLEGLDEWLGPLLWGAGSMADVATVDLVGALRGVLGRQRVAQLDQLAPREITLASGRSRAVDYSGERPTISTRVQDLYGQTSGPSVLDGTLPVTLELLSPAGRPIQVTADLAGFWGGSWSEVRKDMAGRYPKHDWPLDPATAQPPRR
jgi:ATP-dependent helicase HrpB